MVRMPALRALMFIGGKEDFHFRMRKYNGALVAAFRDDVVSGCGRPLPFDELRTDARIVGRVVRGRRDVEASNRLGHIATIEQHTVAGQLDADAARKVGQFLGRSEIDALLTGRQRDRAVHRSGIEEAEAQTARQATGCTALSGAGGSVDGDNHGSGEVLVFLRR